MLAKFFKDFSKTGFLFVDINWMFWLDIGNTVGLGFFFQDESKKAAYDSSSPFEEI